MEPIRHPPSAIRNPPHLVLFDVDGTLLLSGGAGSRCIRRACGRVLGTAFEWHPVVAGRLDQQIYLDLATACGIEDASDHFEAYKSAYLEELQAELVRHRADVTIMPGVREMLAELDAREDVVVGLLTGNFQRATELKLAAADLDASLFKVGAFAEDGQQRSDLVSAAMRKYERLTGAKITPDRVILIGDTPRDIECARQSGCRVLAVATGHYSLETLRSDDPDAAVATLEDSHPLRSMLDPSGPRVRPDKDSPAR